MTTIRSRKKDLLLLLMRILCPGPTKVQVPCLWAEDRLVWAVY